MKKITVARQALKDIGKSITMSNNFKPNTSYNLNGIVYFEIWHLNEADIYNKESRRLNSEIGLSYLNNGGNHKTKQL